MVAKFTIAGDHPSLQGHFPGNPVVPGVVILNEVIRWVEDGLNGRVVVGIKYVKFIKPLRSDNEVALLIDGGGLDTLNIVCEHKGDVLLKGQFLVSGKEAV